MSIEFVTWPLSQEHERDAFACGVEALDNYLKTQAGQDIRRRVSKCFVAVPRGSNVVAGYYTLAASSIPTFELPAEFSRRLPRYPLVPAVLIGRLAVDRKYLGHHLGSSMLDDAIARVEASDPAVYALVVDAIDDKAAGFYRHFGFLPLPPNPLSLFLPMATAMKL